MVERNAIMIDFENHPAKSAVAKRIKSILFLLLALSATVQATDPVVGTWSWGVGQNNVVLPDGAVSSTNNTIGHWSLLDANKRTYRIHWIQSPTPSILQLSEDHNRLIEHFKEKTFVRIRSTPQGSAHVTVRELEIDGFSSFKATQQEPVWCWAACIQMLLKQHGVNWSQEDIATEVKGKTNNIATANAEEITHLLHGFRPNTPSGPLAPGATWKADCMFFSAVDNPLLENLITRSIAVQRPLITSFRSGYGVQHVVVVYKVDYEAQPGALEIQEATPIGNRIVHTSFQLCKRIISLTYYDPLANQDKTVPFAQVESLIQGLWSSFVVRNEVTF